MKKILVIGSTVVDVIINVDSLPTTKGDIHIKSQELSMGGCAYNVSDMIRHFNVPYTLFSPIGTGIYGDYIRKVFAKKGLVSPINTPDMDNGCCYCFVEESGERTFISNHGAEYLIYKEWLDTLDMSEFSSIYICGLEIEEKTGGEIISFLQSVKSIPIFFAPGPRINRIEPELLEKLFALSPILHLNSDEVCEYTKQADIKTAAEIFYQKTRNTVIITTGADGACYFDKGDFLYIPTTRVEKVVDTIGAGDGHIGAMMACLHKKMPLKQSIETANKAAGAVVETTGALLSDTKFYRVFGKM